MFVRTCCITSAMSKLQKDRLRRNLPVPSSSERQGLSLPPNNFHNFLLINE